MANRFINNLHIAPDVSEKKQEVIKMYKQVASLLELNPVFIHFEIISNVVGGNVQPLGTEVTYDVKGIDKLNMTIHPDYIWEISLLDFSSTNYERASIGGGVTRIKPLQPFFIKLGNLTSEPFDFICAQPIEKQNNRIIYLNQQKFPDQLTIQYGHCNTDQNSPEYGEFFDFNIDVAAQGINDPYRLYYDQSVGNVRGRIQIRQIHVT